MSVADREVSAAAQDIPAPRAAEPEPAAPATPAGNPAILGLATFLPSGITLGLWLVGYLDTAKLPGGMIAAVLFSAGLFQLVACIWAARIGASTVAGLFGTFSAFWLSFGFLLLGLVNGFLGVSTDPTATAAQVQNVQATYVLSWLSVFAVLLVGTLRLPLVFTVGLAFVVATFAFVLTFVLTGASIFAVLGGVTTFAFCVVFGFVLLDAFGQDLGAKAMPMGKPVMH